MQRTQPGPAYPSTSGAAARALLGLTLTAAFALGGCTTTSPTHLLQRSA